MKSRMLRFLSALFASGVLVLGGAHLPSGQVDQSHASKCYDWCSPQP